MNFSKLLGSTFPTVQTERIKLRKLKSEDAPTLFNYYSNENVYRYLDWNGPETLERSYEVINAWNEGYDEGWIIRFAIANKVTDEIIGTIFLSEFAGKRAEIGYELSEEYWHRGIMSEVIKEVLSIGFNQLGLVRIQAIVTEENIASKKLLTKFNFKEEGCLRQFECHSVTGECKDMLIYSLLHTEFLQKNDEY
ncbi:MULTISPECIES: GNAT family protein [unclassified Lysinibacillus]|uniref:GNAT family N-acetyltransferase n=1 Tax=unclassified Lysinibacillus TaxID=2636778 RepID=UPI0025521B4B|nr:MULTISPECIES: GNAT family protein [unclassified Lysinibacillus]MDM5250794.1 GNAT family protein [Lysinibacillus sp. G4S2]